MKVTTMRGAEIDMDALATKHGDEIAIGTRGRLRMNARGDLIGAGGKVVQKRADVVAEYNRNVRKAVKQVGLKSIQDEVLPTPQEVVDALSKGQAPTPAPKKSRRRLSD